MAIHRLFLPSPGSRASVHRAHLVAVHHEVVCGDERFENHDPAVAGRALQQRVCQVGDADVQLIGAVDQVWGTEKKNTNKKHHMIRTESCNKRE